MVLDEADEMLNMGFSESINAIFENVPEDSKLPKIDFEMAEFEPKHYFEKKEKAREKAEIKIEAKEKAKAKVEAKEKAPHHRHTP